MPFKIPIHSYVCWCFQDFSRISTTIRALNRLINIQNNQESSFEYVGRDVFSSRHGSFTSSCRPYLSFLRSPIGTGLTEIRGNVEMEPCDWLLANEDVSRLSGDCGGVMRLGLLHSECEAEPGWRGKTRREELSHIHKCLDSPFYERMFAK